MSSDFLTIVSLFLDQARDLWPFYLAGVVFAAFIKTFKWDRRIRASVVRYGKASIFVSTGAGLVSPLCSCGILPVAVALTGAGVPLPPVLALLITSPLMSPDSFIITVGQLGWDYAIWKLAAAATAGLAAGFTAHLLVKRGFLAATGFRTGGPLVEDGSARPGFEEIVAAGCFSHAGEGGGVVERRSRVLFFLDRFRDMGFLVGKFLFAALLVQALVTFYVPANVIEPFLGRGSALSVLFATIVSIPLPLNQVAAPSLIKGLLSAGMSPGAGMAMLIGGPVTGIPALSALLVAYDRKAFAVYLGIGTTVAVAAGILFQAFHG